MLALIGGLFLQQRQIEQQPAEQEVADRAIVLRGEAALRTAQQFGMTPQLHYEIAWAESVLRQREQHRQNAEFGAYAPGLDLHGRRLAVGGRSTTTTQRWRRCRNGNGAGCTTTAARGTPNEYVVFKHHHQP